LVTVELSFDGRFQLRPEDADMLVQISGRDVMWQKERLLNIALRRVPTTCEKIAWLDCDVVFGGEDWVELARRALDEFSLVHLFHERYNLPRDGTPEELDPGDGQTMVPSLMHKLAVEPMDFEDLLRQQSGTKRSWTSGLAWASRREVLEQHGLYDACVLGGGDSAILCAALGKFSCGTRTMWMNDRREAHYLAWARPYFASVRGRVGYVPGRLFHLWHGDLSDRHYEDRHRDMEGFNFDPFTDIEMDRNGCWRWSSNKQEMHEYVGRYFESRKEDGV
jgi:hypothetical protein